MLKEVRRSWPEEDFVLKRVENAVLWTYVMEDLNGEEIVGTVRV